jgi:hypothetical protein
MVQFLVLVETVVEVEIHVKELQLVVLVEMEHPL